MVVQESNLDMQENTYEEEETLSLSDLPLYGHVEWEDQEENLSSSDQDNYFEFNFRQELCPSTTFTAVSPPDTVVFCGKLIPYKQPNHCHEKCSSRTDEKQQNHRRGNKNDHREGTDLRLRKMSILASSSSGKARWYPFFFGITSFSMKMDLRDMRSRQSRRQCSSPPPSPPQSNQMVNRGRNRGRGFWSVIRALSCGGNHHVDTTAAPFIGSASPDY